MVEQAKVGFFGGSFNPIHFGHLKMARELAAAKGLSEVWFCPARISPHKLDEEPVPIEHRLKMVELAILGEPSFSVCDIEARRKGPSYTVDTIKEILDLESKRSFPRKIFLILSDEALPGFLHWKAPEEIVRLVPLLVGSRYNASKTPPAIARPGEIQEAIKKGWCPTEPFNISSTEIRQRLKEGKDCSDLVPKKVLDYIYQNNLYC
jgi:nicotinate-nucleotide adenylyltransferase